MIPELGHFALILALCLALVQAVLPLAGSLNNTPALDGAGASAGSGQFVFIAIAFLALVQSFLSNDFSVLYVAQQLQHRPACHLQDFRGLGRARRFAAAVGLHSRRSGRSP